MDADDSRRTRRNHALNLARVDSESRRGDVAKDGRDLLPLERVRSGDEREGWDDDFARQAERADGDLQRDRRIAHCNAVPNLDEVGDTPLELLHVWAVVRQPSPVKQIVDAREQRLTAADVGPSDVKQLCEGGRAAEDGEIFECVLHARVFISVLARREFVRPCSRGDVAHEAQTGEAGSKVLAGASTGAVMWSSPLRICPPVSEAQKLPGHPSVPSQPFTASFLCTLAGTPNATTSSGISLITTEPAPMTAPVPIRMRSITVVPIPIQVARPTVTFPAR